MPRLFLTVVLFSCTFPVSYPCIATTSPDGRPGIGTPGTGPGSGPGTQPTTTLLVTTTTTTPTTTTTLNPCPSSMWVFNAANGYCYLVGTFPLLGSWQDGEDACVGQGAHLTSILNQAENDFIVMLVMTPGLVQLIDLPWIGIRTTAVITIPPTIPPYVTTWTDGSPFPGSFVNYPGYPTVPPAIGCGQLFYAVFPGAPVSIPGTWANNPACLFGGRKYVCKRLP